MLGAFKTRDYRLLWSGQAISQFGDQFHLVALPWLVLTLTHDPVQLGLVMALAGLPRAAVMLVGGAYADRHSPRVIMLASDALRFLVTAALAASILTGGVRMWMVYALALLFGVISGFFSPAAEAALPRLVEDGDLEGGNAAMMGVSQIASFVGPALAGVLIALFGAAHVAGSRIASMTGIGAAFSVDALSFAVSAAALLAMRTLPALDPNAEEHPFAAVAEGFRFTASKPSFRWMFGIVAVANLLIAGPLMVGVPVIAQSRLAEGAVAFGAILSAYGLGNLFGMGTAAATKRPSDRVFAPVVVALFLAFGVGVAALGFVRSMWPAVATMVVLGVGNGYIAITLMTTLQRMTPENMLGRVMSMLMLAMYGLTPISQALSGAVVKVGPELLFSVAGAGLVATGVVAWAGRRSWSLDEFLEPAPAADAVPGPVGA